MSAGVAGCLCASNADQTSIEARLVSRCSQHCRSRKVGTLSHTLTPVTRSSISSRLQGLLPLRAVPSMTSTLHQHCRWPVAQRPSLLRVTCPQLRPAAEPKCLAHVARKHTSMAGRRLGVAWAASPKGEEVSLHPTAVQSESSGRTLASSDAEQLGTSVRDGTAASSSGSNGNGSPSNPSPTSTSSNGSVSLGSVSSSIISVDETEFMPAAAAEQSQSSQYAWLAFWVGSAVLFGAGLWAFEGRVKGNEFFAGYLLEQCLSLDNLFVFQLVFRYFKTPAAGQATVLTWGIATAAGLRAVLIIAGVQLVQSWKPVLAVFAAILLFSSFKLLTSDGADDGEDLQSNTVIKFCKRFIKTTNTYDGDKFFTTLEDGTRSATPLLLALAVIEISDVVFALDSIPAVFGVTLDPFIVYSSNIFAILSLRSVFQFASTVMTQARYLDKAVAVVLGFIGAKMLLEFTHVDIPTDVSLLFVALVLAIGVLAGWVLPEAEPENHPDKS